MTQRILVLGAGGFIGRHVAARLRGSIWATPVNARRQAVPGTTDATADIQVDATNPAQLRRALEGIAGVVNCVSGNNDTLVGGTRTLIEAAADMTPRPRIVHLSSIAVYGDAVGVVDETTPPGGVLSPYGAAKLEAERLARGGEAVVLRLGIVYGPGSAQWSGRIATLLRAHRLGDLGRGGDGYCNLVYVGDVADAVERALRSPEAGGRIFNLGLPAYPTWNEYFTRFALALGAVPVARISGRRLRIESKLVAPPLKIAEIVAGKAAKFLLRRLPPPIPPSLVRSFGQEIRMNVERAQESLGMQWTPLDEGISQTVNWLRKQVD